MIAGVVEALEELGAGEATRYAAFVTRVFDSPLRLNSRYPSIAGLYVHDQQLTGDGASSRRRTTASETMTSASQHVPGEGAVNETRVWQRLSDIARYRAACAAQ